MSIIKENNTIGWPAFKLSTGKKIELEIEEAKSKDENLELIENENESVSEGEAEVTNDKPKNNKQTKKVDEIIDIPQGSILRINGKEFQAAIQIKENQKVTYDYIHQKVIDPRGTINEWDLKTATLTYDKNHNIFYYVIESPKKG